MSIFQGIILWIILISILWISAITIVNVLQEVFEWKLSKHQYRLCFCIAIIISLGGMFLMSKCSCSFSNGEQFDSPNGKTNIEHYEPRY